MKKLNLKEIWKHMLKKKCVNIIDQVRVFEIAVWLKNFVLRIEEELKNL